MRVPAPAPITNWPSTMGSGSYETGCSCSEPSQLADEMPATGEAVISLDGTSLSQEQLAEVRAALASEVPEDLGEG